ncbi:DUF1549 and DUF1553 domain-containing protein [Lignipirellula cremea]|uniref:BIG2 domain-containing protein n=1 Tax=Lignipirellula cremea TaxID=2528010 RepID=A0A518DQS8_9BACT|nr:DUF1549 and DUF1553 domain-containing protein [Lignipirellula cremea]QDU94174.1 hypothetical protein Pla8534_19620 [Lignipirellula cremea]
MSTIGLNWSRSTRQNRWFRRLAAGFRAACVVFAWCGAGSSVISACAAGPVLPPASQRFAGEASSASPDFQRHVLPLLGRLGCNGRACHGSFQGQGGFQLSLFGYDFAADHASLCGGDSPRVDREDPAESLILQKPTLGIDHEGGERFKPGGWEHRLLQQWIAAGALPRPEEAPTLLELRVEPQEMLFSAVEQTQMLRLIARWSNGEEEDVTPLCRFRSNDESIAVIDASGQVQAVGAGDTHVVAFYDNGVATVSVLLPYATPREEAYPASLTPTPIDKLVVAKLRKLGLTPSELCTDAEFLRRVSLDLTGTPPAPAEIEAFLADSSPDKRGRKIDELLERPTYAAWTTTWLCDLTGATEGNLPVGGEQGVQRDKAVQWYDWIYRRVAENMPYDQLVEGILLAVSREPEQAEADYFAEMSSYFREEDRADFSERKWMPYFWTRGQFSPPQTLRFGYAFLGVRLECAQCHKHPYDQWTKADYEDFEIFFRDVRFRYTLASGKELKEKLGLTADQDSAGYKKLFAQLAHDGTLVPWGDLATPDWKRSRTLRARTSEGVGRVITPRLLGGEELISQSYSDPRQPVMDWLRDPGNPYFARAVVNRVWAKCMGVGLIEPVDDMNLANPASNEPLLAHLAEEFVAHQYDLKWLFRTITRSRTYQLSWRPNATNLHDERNFSRAQLRRLPAEVLCDALDFATATSEEQQTLLHDKSALRDRNIGFPLMRGRGATGAYALKLFGKPERRLVCECERSGEPSLLQTVYLRNDAEVQSRIDRKDGWLAEIAAQDAAWRENHRDALLTEAWLRTLGRPPRPAELELGRLQLAVEEDAAAFRDLLWALLNSKEFILNH